MPHGHCFFWDPWVLWPLVIGDILTWLAYLAIPLTIYMAARRLGVEIPAAGDFIAFILACGFGHLISAINLWQAWYALEAWWCLACGLISLRAFWRIRRALVANYSRLRELVRTAESLLSQFKEPD